MGLFMSNLEAAAPPALDQHHSSASPPAGAFDIRAWHIVVPITLGITLITASECHSITSIPSLRYGFVLAGWWGATALGLWRVAQSRPQFLQLRPAALAVNVAIASLLGIFHLLLMAWMDFLFLTPAVQAAIHLTWMRYLYLNRWGLEMLVYGFIFGVAAVAKLQLLAQRNSMRSLELQKELSAAQLHALQMQVEPHFLFNTLNAITTLVELGQQQKASAMLKHLNIILKTTLTRSAPQKVPLAQELENVENYLAIEQVRFSDRLQLQFRIDPSALNALVPSFLLQPLIENAIRHGISKLEDGGVIQTSVENSNGTLLLRIHDNGPGMSTQAVTGHGIGLRNTASRLAHFYPDKYSFQTEQAAAGGFLVSIAIPFEVAAI